MLFGAAWESALAATFFTALLDLSLERSFAAVEATELLVFLPLGIMYSPYVGGAIKGTGTTQRSKSAPCVLFDLFEDNPEAQVKQ